MATKCFEMMSQTVLYICWSVMCRLSLGAGFLLQCTKCSRQVSLVKRCFEPKLYYASRRQALYKIEGDILTAPSDKRHMTDQQIYFSG